MEKIEFSVSEEEVGKRLDSFIALACSVSRSVSQQWIEKDYILVNGAKTTKSYKLTGGDLISICVPPPRESAIVAQNIPLDILYEDEHLLVVNKPKDMVVHPAAGNADGTLVNALLFHCKDSLSGIGGELRPGIVHRKDKDTSGLLVVAKNDAAHRHLAEQFSNHTALRVYHAVVYGGFRTESGEIEASIGRNRGDRKKMAAGDTRGKWAFTSYEVIGRYRGFTHLAIQLKTGRTHQIRVHMAHIGHAVAGDVLYGPHKVIKELNGQCLHAKTLGFVHPISGKEMLFDTVLPGYFTDFLAKLERNSNI